MSADSDLLQVVTRHVRIETTAPGGDEIGHAHLHRVAVHLWGDCTVERPAGLRWRRERLRPGHVLRAPASTDDRFRNAGQGQALVVMIPPAALATYAPDPQVARAATLPDRAEAPDPLLFQLALVLGNTDRGTDVYRRGALELFLLHVARAQATVGTPGALPRRLVERSAELMRARLATGVTLVELADNAGLSVSHFSALYKRATGESPLRAFQAVRMTQARTLLQTTRLTVAEIAARTGHASPSHFVAAFGRAHGCTPGQFRGR